MASVTISSSLMSHVLKLYWDGIHNLASGRVLVLSDTKNGYSDLAIPAYIMSVAAAEAFTNETFFGPPANILLKETSLYELRSEWIEMVDLREKMVIIARLLCGKVLRRNEQPFQRVHFKFSTNSKCTRSLQNE